MGEAAHQARKGTSAERGTPAGARLRAGQRTRGLPVADGLAQPAAVAAAAGSTPCTRHTDALLLSSRLLQTFFACWINTQQVKRSWR